MILHWLENKKNLFQYSTYLILNSKFNVQSSSLEVVYECSKLYTLYMCIIKK